MSNLCADIAKEFWKPVVGYEKKYEISNLGNIKSLNYQRMGFPKILKPSNNKRWGYLYITLRKNGKIKSLKIHHLVLYAFVGPKPSKKHTASHEDGNRKNNILDNLKWRTYKDNNLLKKKHGTWQTGESHGSSVLKLKDVIKIKELYKTGKYTHRSLAPLFSVSKSAITHILCGTTWKFTEIIE